MFSDLLLIVAAVRVLRCHEVLRCLCLYFARKIGAGVNFFISFTSRILVYLRFDLSSLPGFLACSSLPNQRFDVLERALFEELH
jgi:hypothetical protein